MGVPCLTSCSLDAARALSLTLHYLNSTMHEISLQQIFALISIICFALYHLQLQILAEFLPSIPKAYIKWPKDLLMAHRYSSLITVCHPLLTGAFSTINGLNLLLQESLNMEIKNATQNGWMATHNVSSILVFSPKGLLRFSTSIHD